MNGISVHDFLNHGFSISASSQRPMVCSLASRATLTTAIPSHTDSFPYEAFLKGAANEERMGLIHGDDRKGAELERMPEISPDIPVILSSGYHGSEVDERSHGLVFEGFLQKPSGPRELAAKVLEVLSQAPDRV
jgi:hypothetical protein